MEERSADQTARLARPAPGYDLGRMVAVAVFALLVALNLLNLRNRLEEGGVSALDWLVSPLTIAFYILLTIAYLRRTRTSATDRDWRSWVVAFLGTGLPFLIPLVADGPRDSGTVTTIAAVILVCGLAFMLWSLFYLGTNISVVPQAREVVVTGPYAWVRHPLYTAEICSAAGISLSLKGILPWLAVAGLLLLQVLRARREERLLAQELPGYREYQARTPMLVPARRVR